jgi:hypothetical protein
VHLSSGHREGTTHGNFLAENNPHGVLYTSSHEHGADSTLWGMRQRGDIPVPNAITLDPFTGAGTAITRDAVGILSTKRVKSQCAYHVHMYAPDAAWLASAIRGLVYYDLMLRNGSTLGDVLLP